MRVKSSAEAARAFVEGRREECREWCRDSQWRSDLPTAEAIQRTAEVAREIWSLDSLGRVPHMSATVWDFLGMMAGGK